MTTGQRPPYWCRMLVLAYPRWWRQRHGDELVGSLLDLTDGQGRRRAGLRDVADVLVHGLACRARTPAATLAVRTRAVAGGLGLASAAATSLVLLAAGNRPDTTASAGSVLFAGWLLALATAVAGPTWLARAVLAGTTAVGAAIPVVLSATPLGAEVTRPPLTILGLLTLCGLLALLQPGGRPGRREVLAAAAALTALVAGPLILQRRSMELFAGPVYYGEPQRALSLSAFLIAALLAAAAVAAAVRRARAVGAGAALAALPWLAFGLLSLHIAAPSGEVRPALICATVTAALIGALVLNHLGLRLRLERLPSGGHPASPNPPSPASADTDTDLRT